MAEGRHEEAGARYGAEALALAPDNDELLFWAGLGMAQAGDMEGGLPRAPAIELQPGWRELLDRLSPEIAPSAAGGRSAAALLALARRLAAGTARPASTGRARCWMMRLCSATWAAG